MGQYIRSSEVGTRIRGTPKNKDCKETKRLTDRQLIQNLALCYFMAKTYGGNVPVLVQKVARRSRHWVSPINNRDAYRLCTNISNAPLHKVEAMIENLIKDMKQKGEL